MGIPALKNNDPTRVRHLIAYLRDARDEINQREDSDPIKGFFQTLEHNGMNQLNIAWQEMSKLPNAGELKHNVMISMYPNHTLNQLGSTDLSKGFEFK